jgi:hypothetical protein
MKRKLFYTVTALFLFFTGTVSAQKLDAILTNLMYDATEDAIVFDIEMKAGEGYIPGTAMGSVGAMNLKFDLFLEPDVTVNIEKAIRCQLLGAPNVIFVCLNPEVVIPATANLPRPDGTTIAAMDFAIRCLGAATGMLDFKTDVYTPIARVKIPVTSETKPDSETFLRQRPTILQEDATPDFPLWARSFWGSPVAPIYDGFFENQPDFHLVNLRGTVDVNENTVESIKMFPNPTSGIVHILFERAESSVITLYDLSGKEIYRKRHNEKEVVLNLDYLPSATYLLKINDEGQFKIIVK